MRQIQRSRATTIAVATLVAACEAITDPNITRVNRPEIRFSSLGDTAQITALVGNTEAKYPHLRVTGEQRYVADQAVLDTIALNSGVIRANSAGTALVSVSPRNSPNAAPASIAVRVEPARPVIVSVRSQARGEEEDVFLVHGYRLNSVSLPELRLDGLPVRAELRDSSTLLVRAAALDGGATCTPASTSTLSAPGLDVRGDVRVRRKRTGEVELEVGGMRSLSSTEVRCLRLRPQAGSAYALAYVDPAQVRSSMETHETKQPGYALRVSHLDPVAAPVAQAVLRAAQIPLVERQPHVLHREMDPVGELRCRLFDEFRPLECTRKVLAVGDRLEGEKSPDRAQDFYRVVRVDQNIVFLVSDADSALYTPVVAKALDSAMQPVLKHGLPLIKQVFTGSNPNSSYFNGQLFVFLYKHEPTMRYYAFNLRTGSYGVEADGTISDARSLNFIYIPLQHLTATGVEGTLVHEFTHAWENQTTFESRSPRVGAVSLATWQAEGLATFLEGEAMRRWAGVSPAANYDWREQNGASSPGRLYGWLAAGGTREFTTGYTAPASFLWDLVHRRVRAGEPWETAFQEVARGATEGWFGYIAGTAGGPPGFHAPVFVPYRKTGLTARMQSRLGSNWDPVDALMRWTLSNALDDLTLDPVHQNPSFLRVSTTAGGWAPHAVFKTGAGITKSTPVFVDGTTTDRQIGLSREAGGTGFFFIEDDAKGGTYTVESSRPDLQWVIARFR